ncbi:MAG: molybdopterin-dependent oxidoreductase [Deltaproteobacteria bacterium]|nr:molybdopterin-dependent oxidoreductase [Deltaproteobacteria bacterium]
MPPPVSNEREVSTFCRVCEPACGLVALVKDGELVRLRPDKANPITRGFACNKGLAGDEIHRDSDRVDHPLRRGADGKFERVSWDEAIADIAKRLRASLADYGPKSIAPYIGNPTAFNTLAGPAIGALFAQLGTRRSFSSGTQDCANKFAGSEAVFGSSTMHPVPDLAHTDFFLSFGANPRVSHASFFSIADPVRVMKSVIERGGRVVHVNPRRIESEKTRAGETLLIRPDTDVYLLAALIHEIDRNHGFDEETVGRHGERVAELREFVAQYPPDRVATATGIDADTIRSLARDFAAAPAASVHMSTGVNMGRQGTLAYWLLHMLSFVTSNLDRRGGNILSVGFYASAKAGRRLYSDSFVETEYGKFRKGTLPGNLLADYVTQEEDPVRAMIVVAGNPVLSIGGEGRLREAMQKLDLLVVIDLYRNATAEYADYILPCTDSFERADINITGLGLQYEPWIQFTEKVVEPRGERREEWWILGRIAQELGLKSPFDGVDESGDVRGLWGRIDHMLHGRGLTLEQVRARPHGVKFEGLTPGQFYADQLQTEDGKVDCCPQEFTEALARCDAQLSELDAEGPDRLKMITLRDPYMHNSWYANLDRMKGGTKDRNYLYIHPADAESRELADGDEVRLFNEWGAVVVELRTDPELMRSVVALTHGWGNAQTPGMRVAQKTPGANQNALLPSGPGSYDPLSNQAFMTGVPVEVARTNGLD